MLFGKMAISEALDKMLFPGIQGGPLMHVIAGKAVMLGEALQPSFKTYARQVVKNAKRLADNLQQLGYRLVSGGTDNHMLLIDLRPLGMNGHDAAEALERAAIVVNKNRIPYDPLGPLVTSGLRLGTAAVTTCGMKERQMDQIAEWVDGALRHSGSVGYLKNLRRQVTACCRRFPPPAVDEGSSGRACSSLR